jgi:hypothetical protein
MSLDAEYKDWFIRSLHDALSGHHSSCVSEAIAFSEQSKTRCIGITIETRPDYCLKPHLHEMLSYGCTRIEIGRWLGFYTRAFIRALNLLSMQEFRVYMRTSRVTQTEDTLWQPCVIHFNWQKTAASR